MGVCVCIWLDLFVSLLSSAPQPALALALTLWILLNVIFPGRQDHKHIRVIQNNENKYLNQKKRQ